MNLVANHVIPAVPDFKWGHDTDGSKDGDGYSVVTVQVNLKHMAIVKLLSLIYMWHAGNRKALREALSHTWLRVAKGTCSSKACVPSDTPSQHFFDMPRVLMSTCTDAQVEPKQEKFKLQEATLKVNSS